MINQDLYRWATKTHLYKITLENALFSTSQKLSYQDDSSFPTKLIISLETALSSTSHIYKTPIQSEISTPKWLEKLAHFAISIRLYLLLIQVLLISISKIMASLRFLTFLSPLLLITLSMVDNTSRTEARRILETTLPMVPELPKPELPEMPPLPKVELPTIPKPELPELPKPEVPKLPELPSFPHFPELPKTTLPTIPALPKDIKPPQSTTSP